MPAHIERLLGAHMSIAGGVDRAIDRGVSLGCTAIQIFTGFNNRWVSRAIPSEVLERFRTKSPLVRCIFGHNNYLINLASPDREKSRKSLVSMREEMQRAEQFGLPFLVIHPGSHMGSGESQGLRSIARNLNRVLDETSGSSVGILLETTSGQGSNLGYRFEHLAEIMSSIRNQDRIGVCFDTSHAFAAGYDLRTPETYEAAFEAFDCIIGLPRIRAFHLNDSKAGLGSRRDRHEHIGKGHLGIGAFRLLLHDERFVKIPMVLETPKGIGMEEDRRNLALLRSMDMIRSFPQP
ncbi:MAG: deoxyribonuclease IV [bacterium]